MKNHYLVSFYYDNLDITCVRQQRRVFNALKIPLTQIQIPSSTYADSIYISMYLNSFKDWDYITVLDVDCIPISNNILGKIEENMDDSTLYGNVQASNVFEGETPTLPFVAPHYMTFSKKLWEHISRVNTGDILAPRADLVGPNGKPVKGDRGEFFTQQARKLGYTTKLEYPTKCVNEIWSYKGALGGKPFTFGVGTTYSSDTYHNFQIRIPKYQQLFNVKCEEILRNATN